MSFRSISRAAILSMAVLSSGGIRADGPKDNIVDNVRPIPPLPSVEPTASQGAELQAGIGELGKAIASLRTTLKDPNLIARLPDVEIFYNAVRYGLTYNEIYTYVNAKGAVPKGQQPPKAVSVDLSKAKAALAEGMSRAKSLAEGKTPWTLVSGPRGYLSKIDHSVQPYLLFVPDGYKLGDPKKYRIDLSCHGRGETLSELNFINGKIDPGTGSKDKFFVALYGRYCCANKFAGEIDLFEAWDSVKSQYPIDENRALVIGFSMGGAAVWQFAAHYSDAFAAASPGAGFAETREFLRIYQDELATVPWYQQSLWHLYDCTDYAVNLFNIPTLAYSGELDGQKQSADIMEKYMAEEGLKLDRIIGPKTKHAYEKNAKIELDKRLDEIMEKGRNTQPDKIRFTTWTLRYNHMHWVTVDAMEHHWQRARVEAERAGEAYTIKTENVSELTVVPLARLQTGRAFTIDGQSVASGSPSGGISFVKRDGKWLPAGARTRSTLVKAHGLQGPIDDAFMDSFVIVKPTGKAMNEKVGKWADSECQHAIDHWRKQFRGEAQVMTDAEALQQKPAGNLILFGDPSSNAVIQQIIGQLPIHWDAQSVTVGDVKLDSTKHAPVLIYPNPLDPTHYIVINSGFTFREYDYLNNARQIPKLPDYAVVDLNIPPDSRGPGGIVKAGFFGEKWELQPNDGKIAQK